LILLGLLCALTAWVVVGVMLAIGFVLENTSLIVLELLWLVFGLGGPIILYRTIGPRGRTRAILISGLAFILGGVAFTSAVVLMGT
jgi:hypothetical protein